MTEKLFEDMPSAPNAPRLAKNFPDLQDSRSTWMPSQDPKVLIPVLIPLFVLILIIVATKVFDLNIPDLLMDSSATLMDYLTKALSSVTNLFGNLRNSE